MRSSRIRCVYFLIGILLMYSTFEISGQPSDSTRTPGNIKRVVKQSAVIYTAGMATLSLAWYDLERQPFTWFNDASEWKQMDKAGHFSTTFFLSRVTTLHLKNSGMNPSKAALTGSLISIFALSSIEILDGFSPAYGASVSDIGANVLGGLFYLIQQNQGNDPIVYPKFSFYPSGLASQRPSMLGKNFTEQILKDYNGQTYWMSVDMDRVSRFPRWLNLAVGYGASDMIYARDQQNLEAGFMPYRKWMLGIDIDLSDIPTKHKALKNLFSVVKIIRIPAPAIEFSRDKLSLHPFFF